jgi:glycerol-3-phosphate dehydrogenase (NAD(P)+)
MKVTIIGSTAWGTTLGIILGRRGLEVRLWSRNEDEARMLSERGESFRLPGITLPQGLKVTACLEEALNRAELVILAVPSQTMRENTHLLKPHLSESALILSAAKGLETETAKRMSQVIGEELTPYPQPNICVLSGPNLSLEIAQGLPATTVIAAENHEIAKEVQQIIASPIFRVYTQTDVIGVELGGALKNVIALGVGMCDGMGYGDNAKASLVTRGLAEITRLGVACGADPLTFSGLAGLGDLVATCSSPLSRNRYVGAELAKGHSLSQILLSLKGTAEGISTTVAARKLAQRFGVEMPITEQVYQVLFEGLEVKKAVPALMERELKDELSGLSK